MAFGQPSGWSIPPEHISDESPTMKFRAVCQLPWAFEYSRMQRILFECLLIFSILLQSFASMTYVATVSGARRHSHGAWPQEKIFSVANTLLIKVLLAFR